MISIARDVELFAGHGSESRPCPENPFVSLPRRALPTWLYANGWAKRKTSENSPELTIDVVTRVLFCLTEALLVRKNGCPLDCEPQ
jgi:hypothetical protein